MSFLKRLFKNTPTDTQHELMEKLVSISREVGEDFLNTYNDIFPFGVIAQKDGEITSFYPDKSDVVNKDDAYNEMCQLVLSHFDEKVNQNKVNGAVLVYKLESDDEQTGLCTEVKVNEFMTMLIYPYSKVDGAWVIKDEDVQNPDTPMFGKFFPKW